MRLLFSMDSNPTYYCVGDAVYSKPCRCGGHYAINDDDLTSGVDLTCCDVCSLTIRVLYQQNQHFYDDVT